MENRNERSLGEIMASAMEKVSQEQESTPKETENMPKIRNGSGSRRNNTKDDALNALFRRVAAKYRDCRPPDCPELSAFNPDGSNGVFLEGGTGIGKTYLATALARKIISGMDPSVSRVTGDIYYDSSTLEWVSTPYLLARIRDTFRNGKSEETERGIIDAMINCRVLVLDDLGAEKATEFTGMTLYTILSGRDNENRMTIVTTNQTLSEIDSWEPRIASRLSAMQTIRLPNRDRRVRP